MVDSPGVGSSAAGATPQRGSPARAARAGGLEASPAPGPPPPARVLRSPALLARLGSGPRRSGQLRPNRASGGRGSIQNPPHRGHAAQTRGVYGLRWYTCRSKGLEGPLWASHGGVPGQRRGL